MGFTWTNDEKKILAVSASDGFEFRIESLLGKEFIENTLPVEQIAGALSLTGRVSQPMYHRPNRLGQHLFINSRPVISAFVSQKILESYATRLSPHRFPLFVLHLRVPPAWIDVNVHPQKKEIRIREEEKLSSFIFKAMESALEQRTQGTVPCLPEFPIFAEIPEFAVSETLAEYKVSDEQKELFLPKLEVLGKIKNYFFIQGTEGVRVVDAIRALERLIYEEMQRANAKPAVQTLLLPLRLTFAGKEAALLNERLKELNEKGVSIRHFGGDTYLVDAIPALLEPHEIEDMLYAYLEHGKLGEGLDHCLRRRDITLSAGAALIEKLFKCKNPDFTPSGKKIHQLLDEKILSKILT